MSRKEGRVQVWRNEGCANASVHAGAWERACEQREGLSEKVMAYFVFWLFWRGYSRQ